MMRAYVKIERKEQDAEIIDLEQYRRELYREQTPGYKKAGKGKRSSGVKKLTLEDLFLKILEQGLADQFFQLRYFTQVAIWNKFCRLSSQYQTVELVKLTRVLIDHYSPKRS